MATNSSDFDCSSVESLPKPWLLTAAFLVFGMAIFGTMANTLAIVALARSKRLRTSPSTAFVINLSFSQLLMCSVFLTMMGVNAVEMLNNGRVHVGMSGTVFLVIVSRILNQGILHSIAVIAFNRMVAVKFPLVYQQIKTARAVVIMLAGVWVSSFLFWLPLILKYNLGDAEYCMAEMRFEGENRLGMTFNAVICYLLPVLFTVVCYCVILVRFSDCHHVGGKDHKDWGEPTPTTPTTLTFVQHHQPWKDEVTQTILVVFVILVVCSTPHSVMRALEPYLPIENSYIWALIHLLCYIQYVVDPIVYVIMSPRYRQAFADVIELCCRMVRRSKDDQYRASPEHSCQNQTEHTL
ncbi:protein trapped in endoderm-1-like [Oratosquilla oratoria]|uniref:protein trapped in endoderm-1-like n=1 Tax=Oratosquilla oratoria TaxID=337810 RepID=UPI003F7584C3